MIEQIKQANFLSKQTKKLYNWCLKNLPPEGIEIIEESFNNFLEKASLAANEPIDKLSQKIPINMVWKIRWLVEIARLPNDKTKMEAIKKIAQDPHGWKSKDVKKLCAMLKAIEKSLNPEIEKTKNSNNNSNNKKLELICHLYNIDFAKIQHDKNKKLIVFLLLLFKDENAAKFFAFSSNELLNFFKKAMITEETLIKLTKDEIIALLLLSKKTRAKTTSIIHSYKEVFNENNN